ncbi:hypothetical protein BIY21_20055 [Vibrio ponticus]|uniref:Uncharacterized protein n=1 Tax=Vibrio ponticus TaxID=265668 RepID=A0ABX3F852_9VIBR|nr:hypothetical protein [Vibrio ponticus]OLQ84486.1 hypothetical protein BIY21_20055 [Vibrio ponticus]
MNQFDKTQIITLDIHQPEQIESALIQYQALLKSGEAFNQHQFDVEFKQQDAQGVRRLQPSDAGDNLELLKSALHMGQEGGSHYYAHEITDQREVYISEVILFAAALQYPELKATVVETAKAIVAYARRVNDTDDMWIDDMRVFGIEAVYMLAKTDLQYAYLVGQFFVPYWDDEHATQYEEYLAAFLNEHGWHPEVIKAFIWCDNPSFRLAMFMDDPYSNDTTYQPLGEYLQQNPCQYASFKQLMVERFKAEPVLLVSYDESDDDEADLSGYKPVIWLYQTLFARSHDHDEQEDDAFMQQPFMASTLEDEAYDLQCYIESHVSGDLVKPAERALEKRAKYRAYLERDDRRFDLNYGSEVLKPLILALPQGERLWRYIEDGSELEALESLQEIELLPLAHQHASEMADHIDDHVCKWEYNNQGIAEEIESILELVRGDLLTDHFGEGTTIEHANGLITTLTITPDSEVSLLKARYAQYLRVIDVFYRALGKREFSEYMMESLTDDDEPLISRQDYYRRYSQLPEPKTEAGDEQDGALTREMQSIFYSFTDNDEILYKKNFQLVDSVLRNSRELCHPDHYPRAHMGFIALACYQLHADFNQRIGDDVTEALFNYLNQQNIWQQAVDKILEEAFIKGNYHCPEHKGLTEQDIARVRDYFCAENPSEDLASLLALLEPQLHRDDCCRGNLYLSKFSEYQPGYEFLHDHDEDFQRFTLIAFWLRQLPLPLRAQADRLWQFIKTLAPVRVARNVLRAYSDGPWGIEFDNVLDDIEIHEQLEKAGIDSGILKAYEMSRVSGTRDIEKYSHWLDRYSEITNTSTSMFGSLDRKKAEALHEGLKFINESTRVAFLHHASLKYPDIKLDIEHDFERALRLVIQRNTTSWEFALGHELGTNCLYVGEGDKVPAKLRKQVIVNEHTVHDKRCHMDGMSWLASTLVQKQGDKYVVLMADKEVPLEVYQNGLPNGMLVILDEAVDHQAVLTRVDELQQTPQRIEHLLEQTLAYLAGNIDYPTISALYRAQIETENLRPSLDEYRLYSLGQLLWMLEKPQRDKLAKLLFNHDYRGFKFIERQHEKAWLIHQFAEGEIDFDSYLEQEREEDVSEEGMLFLLNWMLQLEIDAAHMTLFCIKHAEFEACGEFIQVHARGQYGDFKRTLNYLHAGRRAQLPEILSQADDATQLMEPLTKDRSRVVKEALAKCVLLA